MQDGDLFAGRDAGGEGRRQTLNAARPLADRLRPSRLADIVGQDHLFGPDGIITRRLAGGGLPSLIFWGPPGTGKTTAARILAADSGLHHEVLSAIGSGVADLRKVFEAAGQRLRAGQGTLLFVDEVHRFNRAQQDAFLPVIEDGTITLIGATTENPSFALNGALLSRAMVCVFKPLDTDALMVLAERAFSHLGVEQPLPDWLMARLAALADGDGRALLGAVDAVAATLLSGQPLPADEDGLDALVQRKAPRYDRDRDGHYDLISALHKSVRGSDPDAALYWLARMLEGGEDPLFLARRLIRMASEDIGLADPQALPLAMAARDAYQMLGSPEGELALAEIAVYLASAPKSNAVYTAYKAARQAARDSGTAAPPMTIVNAPTRLMKDLGHGAGYIYDHDTPEGFSGQNYFPEETGRLSFYRPVERGFEREIARRLDYFVRLRDKRAKEGGV
ncbi:MAG: replication-associated recombination protein A [Hyphomicrobiaceae bacterium]|nr:replication-associated recombination protein A [Hyphomicrobiaceae bacterium]